MFVNGAFSRATGFDPREVIGRTPNVTVGEGTERPALERIEAALRAGKPVHEQLPKCRKDGSSYWVELTIIPVLNKIDLPAADPDKYAKELASLIGGKPEDVLRVSGTQYCIDS